MAIDATDRFAVDLTREGLAALDPKIDPLVIGDDWRIRMQLRNEADAAVALTGYAIAMSIVGISGTKFQRKSGAVIPTTGLMQIEADADQVGEITTPGLESGKGWFTIRFGRQDEAELLPFAGEARPFDVRFVQADSNVREFMMGKIDLIDPYTNADLS